MPAPIDEPNQSLPPRTDVSFDDLQWAVDNPIRVAVVGQTNVGKTSLVRTLTRRTDVGPISDRPKTTRAVSQQPIYWDRERTHTVGVLHDTPGFTNAPLLHQRIYGNSGPGFDADAERIIELLRAELVAAGDDETRDDLEQDVAIFEAISHCQVVLYVIDVGEDPEEAKYKLQLEVLARTGKPCLGVFNFQTDHVSRDNRPEWLDVCRKRNVTHFCDYDAFHRSLAQEQGLLERIGTQLEDGRHRVLIEGLKQEAQRHADDRLRDDAEIVAAMIVDAAAVRVRDRELLGPDDHADREADVTRQLAGRLGDVVRHRLCSIEKQALDQMIREHGLAGQISVADQAWDPSVESADGGYGVVGWARHGLRFVGLARATTPRIGAAPADDYWRPLLGRALGVALHLRNRGLANDAPLVVRELDLSDTLPAAAPPRFGWFETFPADDAARTRDPISRLIDRITSQWHHIRARRATPSAPNDPTGLSPAQRDKYRDRLHPWIEELMGLLAEMKESKERPGHTAPDPPPPS